TARRLLEGRTPLLIAHRRSTLRLADRIAVVDAGRVADVGTHEELMAGSALYRRLLAGPGDDCEGEEVPDDGLVAAGGVTAAAWTPVPVDGNGQAVAAGLNLTAQTRIGGGGGGGGWAGGGGGGMMASFLAPTPQLLAQVAALPPADAEPDVDVEREAAHDPHFSLRRFTRPFRRPLTIGLFLVVLDTLFTLAGPTLVRLGIDRGVTRHSAHALWVISAIFAAVSIL